MSKAYCYGMISPSTVHILRSDFTYPKANTYAEIDRTLPSVGGEATNSAIVLAKLGLKTQLDGNWLHPKNAEKVRVLLGGFGIDLSRLSVNETGGTEEWLIVDKNSRTVFGNYASFHTGPRQWNAPRASDIEDSAIACIDPYFRQESLLAAQICVEASKPYVTLDCPYDGYLAQNAAAIVSHELRDQAYADRDSSELFAQFQSCCNGLVIFTFGHEALWYGRRGGARQVWEPYAIDPIDTTGAGDSFRGAIAYGVLNDWSDERTIDFASAVAACVCLTVPHALNAPGLDGILAFMDQNRDRKRVER